ncbi:MAG: prepilin-type N-terminal cleavage/methylation domain-containing protein, partial [Acinetobacter sp.]|nr:prepilin-type N-terminal cleavage/methylation domain-containing protein [Acinetobacter sp.]
MKRKMSGYTLVELMVALVLGLIVVLVAVQMLLAGQRSV